ncbi:hypothetical protein [Dapis sp. BLCC M172]|uniref:hypothetical protein n=1 Tax=Dapis sp. BLCC M172 TaxID=2975281 RepID=UPI003CE6B7A5
MRRNAPLSIGSVRYAGANAPDKLRDRTEKLAEKLRAMGIIFVGCVRRLDWNTLPDIGRFLAVTHRTKSSRVR